MAVIREDSIGLYVSGGGYKTRPVKPTRFKKGDKVKTHHYGGTTRVGVGKDETCERGGYLELWLTTGMMCEEKISKDHEYSRYMYYKVICNNIPDVVITKEEHRVAMEYHKKYILHE